MSKGNKIRLSKKDKANIANTTRQFNSKLTRTIKAHPEFADYLPDRIKADDLRSINNRQDFNKKIKEYSRFLTKGAEMPILTDMGLKTTKWEKKEVGIKIATINRQRTMETKQANVSTIKGTMGTIQSNNLNHKKYDINKISPRDWDMYKRNVNKQTMASYKNDKMNKYKDNYLKSIINNLGADGASLELYDYIQNNVSPNQMYNAYYDDPVLQIQFTSDPLPVDVIATNALEHWKKLLNE